MDGEAFGLFSNTGYPWAKGEGLSETGEGGSIQAFGGDL
jgi:hypothetical protein